MVFKKDIKGNEQREHGKRGGNKNEIEKIGRGKTVKWNRFYQVSECMPLALILLFFSFSLLRIVLRTRSHSKNMSKNSLYLAHYVHLNLFYHWFLFDAVFVKLHDDENNVEKYIVDDLNMVNTHVYTHKMLRAVHATTCLHKYNFIL